MYKKVCIISGKKNKNINIQPVAPASRRITDARPGPRVPPAFASPGMRGSRAGGPPEARKMAEIAA